MNKCGCEHLCYLYAAMDRIGGIGNPFLTPLGQLFFMFFLSMTETLVSLVQLYNPCLFLDDLLSFQSVLLQKWVDIIAYRSIIGENCIATAE